MPAPDSPFGRSRILPADVVITTAPDGSIRARSPHALGPYPTTLTDRLAEWAARTPEAPFIARRQADGRWLRLTYADTWARVQRVAAALVRRGLGRDRTVLILSGNSLEHQILALAAMHVGVPYAPIAPAYSLMVEDFETLRSLVISMRPGLVFADDGATFERALAAVVPSDVEVVTVQPIPSRASTRYDDLEAVPATPAVDDAHARTDSQSIAKVLFTSGSTGQPKGVINTHGMITANLEQIRTVLQFLADEPPVICDWLPWNHTFGGNHNVGIALYNGGTLYIDDGRPSPAAFGITIRNLREIAPTAYFNVPKGYEMLLPFLVADPAFRRHFFSRVRVLFYAAAGIRPETADAFQRLAVETLGHPVPWVTGLGATESGPSAMFTGPLLTPAAEIGVPVVGLDLKATRVGDLLEARIKGPNVTPGYWGDPSKTRDAFDEEGFYKMGDAIAPVDPDRLDRGFRFQGRIAEDFKLSTGTWVRVGALRSRLLAIAGDLITDVVVAGHDRDRVGALLFPHLGACRTLAGLPDAATAPDVLGHPVVRRAITDRLRTYNLANVGSSTAISRAMLLASPPSLDAREITDKGSLNQRAVLTHRVADVEKLYRAEGPDVLID